MDKVWTELFFRGIIEAARHGCLVRSYQEYAKTEEALQAFLSFSDYGFCYFDKGLILYNADQSTEEAVTTIWHEVGHIVLHTLDEDKAEEYAKQIISKAQQRRSAG